MMNHPKYRLAHEYLISRIRLRSGEVETPVQKYDRLLSVRTQAWKNENFDKRHLLRSKELYHIHKLEAHLNWQQNTQLKKALIRKSKAHFFARFVGFFLVFAVLIGSMGLYIQKSLEQRDFEEILYALRNIKGEKSIETCERQLVTLASKSVEFKKRVLLAVLQDTVQYRFADYPSEPMPYLAHALIGLSTQNKNIFIDYSLANILPNRSVLRFDELFSWSALDSTKKTQIVPTLVRWLRTSNDPFDQMVISEALGEIGPQAISAKQDLINILQKSYDFYSRESAADALKKINPKMAKEADSLFHGDGFSDNFRKSAQSSILYVNFLISLLEKNNSDNRKGTVAFCLGAMDSIASTAVDPLIKLLLTTQNLKVKKEVVTTLGKMGPNAFPALKKLLLKTEDLKLMQLVINTLGSKGSKALPLFENQHGLIQKKQNLNIQKSVIDSLREITDNAAKDIDFHPLIDLLKPTTDPLIFINIFNIIRSFQIEDAVVPYLINLLEGFNEPQFQIELIGMLTLIGTEAAEAVPTLKKFLKETNNPSVQMDIARALESIGTSEAVQVLVELLNDSTEPFFQQQIISAIKGAGSNAALAEKDLLELLIKTPSEELRLRIFETLEEIPSLSNETMHTLISLLNSSIDSGFKTGMVDLLILKNRNLKGYLPQLLEIFYAESNFERKYSLASAMLENDHQNKEYLKNLIEVILPHPIVGYEKKGKILKLVGRTAGKEAAGDSLNFGGDMWEMLDWWEKQKKN